MCSHPWAPNTKVTSPWGLSCFLKVKFWWKEQKQTDQVKTSWNSVYLIGHSKPKAPLKSSSCWSNQPTLKGLRSLPLEKQLSLVWDKRSHPTVSLNSPRNQEEWPSGFLPTPNRSQHVLVVGIQMNVYFMPAGTLPTEIYPLNGEGQRGKCWPLLPALRDREVSMSLRRTAWSIDR